MGWSSASDSVDLPAECTLFLKENSLTGSPSILHNGGYNVPRHSFTFEQEKTTEPGAGYGTRANNKTGGEISGISGQPTGHSAHVAFMASISRYF